MASPSVVISKAELMMFIDRLDTWAKLIHGDLERLSRRLEDIDKTIQDQSTMIKEGQG